MLWKIIERVALVCGLLLTAVITYYTVRLYYAERPPAPVEAPTMTVGAAPWWLYALGGVGIALLLTGWAMMWVRIKRPAGASRLSAQGLPLVEFELGAGRLSQVSPWLELFPTFYNATGLTIGAVRAEGRIAIAGQEFHGQIELVHRAILLPDTYGKIGLKVPLSKEEADYMLRARTEQNQLLLTFTRAVVVVTASGDELRIGFPQRIHFNSSTGTPSPLLVNQLQR